MRGRNHPQRAAQSYPRLDPDIPHSQRTVEYPARPPQALRLPPRQSPSSNLPRSHLHIEIILTFNKTCINVRHTKSLLLLTEHLQTALSACCLAFSDIRTSCGTYQSSKRKAPSPAFQASMERYDSQGQRVQRDTSSVHA